MSTAHTSTDRAATWLRPNQIQRLRTACYDEQFRPRLRQRNEAIVALLYDTGLRVGELVHLDVDRLDLDSGELRLSCAGQRDTQRTASPQDVTITLDPTHSLGTVRVLKSYLYNRRVETSVLFPSRERDRLTPKAVRDVVTKAAEIATIRPYTPTGRGDACDVSPQTIRHSTAWRLLNTEERSMAAVQERLRHTSRSTTRSLYTHLEPGSPDTPAVGSWEALTDHIDDAVSDTSVLNAIPDVLYVFDTNGQMQWWNDRLPAVTGYTDAEIARMHPLEFVPDDDTPRLAAAISRVVEHETVETRESHLVTKAGTHIPYELNGAPLVDDDGEVWGVGGTGRDITARKQAARAAERERERFEQLVDAVTEYAIFLLDSDGHITSWNRGAERIKGYSESEILGEHFSVLYPDDAVENDLPAKLLDEAAAAGSVEDEGWRVRKDGTTFWAHVTITALYDDGDLHGFAKVTRDMTERRQREREIERQRDELERVNRINTVIRDVDQALVQASGRAGIEQAVCDRFASVDPYDAAWIGDSRSTDQHLTPRAWAGIDEDDLDPLLDAVNHSDRSHWPSRRALQTNEVHVSRNLPDVPTADASPDHLAMHEGTVAIAIPILHRETRYGVLVVYADDSTTVGERQQTVLAELGETIGYAIAAVERKAALVADSVVELTIGIRDPKQFFVRMATQLGASVTLEGVARRGDASYLEYFTVTGASPAAIRDLVDQLGRLDHARVIDHHDDECLCEVGVPDASILTTIAEYGGTITEMTAANGHGSVRVELPQSVEAGHVIDALEATVAGVDLQAKQTIDRPIQTEHRFRSTVEERLTDKQREALEAAYLAGFFEHPRLSTGEEIAASLGISSSTFHQHVRVGLQKLLTVVVETTTGRHA